METWCQREYWILELEWDGQQGWVAEDKGCGLAPQMVAVHLQKVESHKAARFGLLHLLGVQDTGPGVELTEDVQIQLIWVQLEPNHDKLAEHTQAAPSVQP